MKKIFFSLLFVLTNTLILSAQQDNSPLFKAGNTPDSIVAIKTILPGSTDSETMTVEVTDGWAKIEGDIVLGRIEELQGAAQDRGDVILGNQFRWPNATIPYELGPGFTDEYYKLIVASCEYVSGATHLNLEQNPFAPNRIIFNPALECSSLVGMQGGAQLVSLKDPFAPWNGGEGCYFTSIIHEIAHAAGLWHEQSRVDRDVFVIVLTPNIIPNQLHNFDKHINDGTPIGPYDFASVMHYNSTFLSVNGQPTIVALHGESFGNATEYSDGDVATINYLYPFRACQQEYYPWLTVPVVSRPLVYEAEKIVYANGVIVSGNKITYDSGKEILLKPGFEAKGGSVFLAVIEGCGGVYQMTNSGDMDEWIYDAEQHHQNPQSSAPTTLKPTTTETTTSIDVTPNPFTSSTTITYTLPVAQDIDIQIFNALGNLVAQPVRQEQQTAGLHEYNFEASGLSTGVYFLVMQTGGQKLTKRVVLSR